VPRDGPHALRACSTSSQVPVMTDRGARDGSQAPDYVLRQVVPAGAQETLQFLLDPQVGARACSLAG
jgi:hypothetical protein